MVVHVELGSLALTKAYRQQATIELLNAEPVSRVGLAVESYL